VTTFAEVFAGVYASTAAHSQHQDAGNTDGIMALYTPDAVLVVPGMGTFQGADAIRATWDAWKPRGLQRHIPFNIVITDWNDDEARVSTDVIQLVQPEKNGTWTAQMAARYLDVFRPVDGQWLFSRREDLFIGFEVPS